MRTFLRVLASLVAWGVAPGPGWARFFVRRGVRRSLWRIVR